MYNYFEPLFNQDETLFLRVSWQRLAAVLYHTVYYTVHTNIKYAKNN